VAVVDDEANQRHTVMGLHLEYFDTFNCAWRQGVQGSNPVVSRVYGQRYVIISCLQSESIHLWDLQQRAIVHEYKKKSGDWCECALVGQDHAYLAIAYHRT
jgi:hypothetical protein